MTKRILALALLLMLLTACRAESLTNGVVVEKGYEPGWVQLMPIYNGETFTYIPVSHPAQWTITVEGEGSESGEKYQEVINVTQAEYDQYNIGDKYKQEEQKDEKDTNGL